MFCLFQGGGSRGSIPHSASIGYRSVVEPQSSIPLSGNAFIVSSRKASLFSRELESERRSVNLGEDIGDRLANEGQSLFSGDIGDTIVSGGKDFRSGLPRDKRSSKTQVSESGRKEEEM